MVGLALEKVSSKKHGNYLGVIKQTQGGSIDTFLFLGKPGISHILAPIFIIFA